jgi:mannosyltransferase OCH1-like enzyme
VPILKADFLRQLILYADGGVWSDLDVTCHQPIDSWIPAKYKDKANLVVGLEFDGNQFASWTVMAKPRANHIAAAIDYIINTLEYEAGLANTTISGLTMKTISDVVLVTGPQAMTRAILQSISVELGEKVDGGNVSNLQEPVLLHDVLVLPNAAFAAMQGGWPKDQGPYFVEHHYAGSWKNDQGGESGGGSSGAQDQEEKEKEKEKQKAESDDGAVKTEVREDGDS